MSINAFIDWRACKGKVKWAKGKGYYCEGFARKRSGEGNLEFRI